MISKRCYGFLIISMCLLIISTRVSAQPGIEYGENYIVFEAEATSSPLDKWILREPGDPNYLKYETSGSLEPINQTYIEFAGAWASADSPLTYQFTCPKTGDYRMVMRMHQPLKDGEAADQRNDVFVRLEGNYTSATSKPKSDLEKNHKFWGRGVNKWGACHSLEIGNHLHAIYGLIEGEEYTFTMSGRSPGASIDYIVFYEGLPDLVISGKDLATTLPEEYRPGPGTVDPVDIFIIPDTTSIRFGTSMQLATVWEPDNVIKDLQWSSSDDQIISVDENGKITAVGDVDQTAIISATSTVNDSSASSLVNIVEWYLIPIDSIMLSPERDTVADGSTISLKLNIWPKDADDPSVLWSSSDTTVATVDQNGVVTTIASGSVNIRVSSNENGSIYSEASFLVVHFIQPFVEFDDKDQYLGKTFKSGDSIVVTINYHAGTFQTVKAPVKVMLREIKAGWQVEKDVFTADLDSYIGSTSGTITLTIPLEGLTPSNQLPQGHFYFLFTKCYYTNGQEAEKGLSPIKISAEFPIESITISLEKDTIAVDSTLALRANLYPENTDETLIIWTSSNSSIASVDQNGVISAKKIGSVRIAATSLLNNIVFGVAEIEIVEPIQVSIETIDLNGVLLYPNPVNNVLNIRFREMYNLVDIRIFDSLGRMIQEEQLQEEHNQIPVDELSSGLYFVKLMNDNSVLSRSFIKE